MVCNDGKLENHVIFEKEVPDSYRNKFIGAGATGNCYLTDNSKIFKEMSCKGNFFFDLVNVTKLKSDYFVFPDELVYVGERKAENLVGCTMDYVKGIDISNTDEKIDIRDIIKASKDVEKEIYNLTRSEGLRMYDLQPGNVLYDPDNSKFRIIDTDCYEIGPYYSFEENYRNNICEWGYFILFTLAEYYNFKNEDINNYFAMSVNNGRVRPSIVLSKILEAIEEETKESVDTLEDFNKGLSLVKRK